MKIELTKEEFEEFLISKDDKILKTNPMAQAHCLVLHGPGSTCTHYEDFYLNPLIEKLRGQYLNE